MTNLIRSLRALIFALSILIRSRVVYRFRIFRVLFFRFFHTFSFVEDPLQPKLYRSKVVDKHI